jgi:hypothetical protein
MSLTSSIARWVIRGGFAATALYSHFACAQSAPSGEAPKLTESFTLTLSPHRDTALRQTIEAMKQYEETQRVFDLKAADASVFTRAIDLLRFVPFKLSNSSGNLDDFFTPNYLRAGCNEVPSEAHLFDTR